MARRTRRRPAHHGVGEILRRLQDGNGHAELTLLPRETAWYPERDREGVALLGPGQVLYKRAGLDVVTIAENVAVVRARSQIVEGT